MIMTRMQWLSLVFFAPTAWGYLPTTSRHWGGRIPFQQQHSSTRSTATRLQESTAAAAAGTTRLSTISDALQRALKECQTDVVKTCKVKVAPVASSNDGRLGLIATESINKNDVILAMPYDDRYVLSANLARTEVFADVLPLSESLDSFWTGEAGLIALLVLNEVAKASSSTEPPAAAGIDLPERTAALQQFMAAWVSALPSPSEMEHPFLWSEEDQEILQFSSTNKIYKKLDDIEDDATWLTEKVFSQDRIRFPESVTWKNGETIPCFSPDGFKWAMAIALSRSFFLDGSLRLIPFMDMCNHDDKAQEVQAGTMGAFGIIKGAQLVAAQKYAAGDQVFCSYGPKSAADYLLEHGFCPEQCWKTAVSELTFEIDPKDRFRDDKLDILEFETYDQAPMDPVQTFDVVSAPGRDGEPDPAMVQFLRLCKLNGTDAFLLESIFRKEVWGFMALPVSEMNELAVVNAIADACQTALKDFEQCPVDAAAASAAAGNSSSRRDVCTQLREAETKALRRTLEFVARDKEALDLKEYYQERRLKDLGLDSDWSPEDDMMGEDFSFGQTRAPGGADYDW